MKRLALIIQATGDYFRTFKNLSKVLHTDIVYAAHCLEDKKWVISTGGMNHETLVWNAETSNVYATLQSKGKTVYGIAWNGEGNRIAWGNQVGFSNRYPLTHTFSLADLEFSGPVDSRYTPHYPDDLKRISPGEIQMQNAQGIPVSIKTDGITRLHTAFRVSRSRVVAGSDSGIHIYDGDSGKYSYSLVGPTGEVYTVQVSPNGKYLLAGCLDRLAEPPAVPVRLALGLGQDFWRTRQE